MLQLFHCPQTRSTRILWLLEELGKRDEVTVKQVGIARADGSASADPRNPHPDGKVPLLVHDGAEISESAAITLYLTDMFPQAGLGRAVGDPQRGPYLTWLHYYGGVIEPVLVVKFSSMEPDAMFTSSFRGFDEMGDRLANALENQPYLLGDSFSAADLLIAAPFISFAALMPDRPVLKDWVARCAARPLFAKTSAEDQKMLENEPAGADKMT
ncbi:MAG: glutathione S-transferase family protein [Rhodobacteraceae bacterium]|nr:glutathione S-transferase family protein [Paracoccaceae bacterium]